MSRFSKHHKSGTQTTVKHVVGDVRSHAYLIVDAMMSMGGTIAGSIEALLRAGARPEIWITATHGLLLEGARENASLGARRGRELALLPISRLASSRATAR
jgi:ribose-phosphate pyrophosphokinase